MCKVYQFSLGSVLILGNNAQGKTNVLEAVYLCAIGGAGALASRCIKKCEVIAFEDLGCESVKKLEFLDFPLIVAIDSEGNNLYEAGRTAYLQQK